MPCTVRASCPLEEMGQVVSFSLVTQWFSPPIEHRLGNFSFISLGLFHLQNPR